MNKNMKKSANIIVASGPVIIENGEVLLNKHGDDDFWKFPGGRVELKDIDGENSLEDACRREAKEENGFEIKYPSSWNYGPNIKRYSPFFPNLVFCPSNLIDLESDRGCKWYMQQNGLIKTNSPIFLYVDKWADLTGSTKEEKMKTGQCKPEKTEMVNNIEANFFECDGKKTIYFEDPIGIFLYKFFLDNSGFSDTFYKMFSTFRFTNK